MHLDGICLILPTYCLHGHESDLDMNLTNTEITKLNPPASGYALHWDDRLRGFGLRVTATGAKSFIAEARVNGKTRRVTLGRFGTITADEARRKAKTKLGRMADGVDLAAEKKRSQALSVTLEQVTESYLANRRRKDGQALKDRTKSDVRYHLDKTFPDWKKKPVVSISREMIQKRYAERCKASAAQSNQAMRVLSAIMHYAMASYRTPEGEAIIRDNPVSVLSETKTLREVKPRNNAVPLPDDDEAGKPGPVGCWWSVVQAMRHDPSLNIASRSAADLVAMLTLTGLRLGEGRSIRWVDLNLEDGSLQLTDTKNRDSIILPLSDSVVELLKARRNNSEWVFPARSGNGHLKRIETHLAKIEKQTGIKVSAHDLRRTFIQIGFKALKIELWRIKMLANHKVPRTDITLMNYGDMADRRKLRAEANQIADYLETQRALHEADNVVSMERRA